MYMNVRWVGPLFVLISACMPSLGNLETNPQQVAADLQMTPGAAATADTFVSGFDDPTFVADPTLLLGAVAIVRRASADVPCPDAWQNAFTWNAVGVRGLPLTPPREAELRGSTTVTQETAAQVDALQFLSAQLTTNQVASVVVTDVDVRRVRDSSVVDGGIVDAAVQAFWEQHHELHADPTVCRVMYIAGMEHTTVAYRAYTQIEGNATGGYAGIQVNGRYYSSSEAYTMRHVFGLSFRVIHSHRDGEATSMLAASGDPLTDAERSAMHGLPEALLHAVPAPPAQQ